jgi:TonB family protein
MKLAVASIILTGMLFSQPSIAIESENFSHIYNAYKQAQKSGDIEQTLALAKQAVTLGETKFKDDRESLNNLKFNLAAAYIDAKQLELAEEVYINLRDNAQQKDGKTSQAYFLASLDLLDLYAKTWPIESVERRNKKASKVANQVIALVKKLEKHDPTLAPQNYYMVAKILYANPAVRGNYKNVLKITEKARDLLVERFGENDLKTIETKYLAGRLNMTPGRYRDAIENLEAIISTINGQLETSHPYAVASHAALIEAYEKLGKSEEATKHCVAIGQMTPWQDDVEPTPLYRTNPKYPVIYAKSGKEGYTRMTFDINTSGFVKNVKIVDSSGKLFTDESIAALNKWRYAPKFENGQAVTATGLEVQLDYRLEPN